MTPLEVPLLSMQLAPPTAALVQADEVSAKIRGLIADAIAACDAVRAAGLALNGAAARKLRAIREAGRLLALVQRSDGGRPLKNSSCGLTSYQFALKQAGISRQTATVWRRVAEISDMDFEGFIVEAQRAGHDLTIAELLRACSPKSDTPAIGRTVKLVLSDAEYRAFQQYEGVLRAVYFTETTSQTVMAVLRHAYNGWLAAQARRPRASGESAILSPRL
jgi:hypothetical protein